MPGRKQPPNDRTQAAVDAQLDRELDDSFPASDPPKITRRSRQPEASREPVQG